MSFSDTSSMFSTQSYPEYLDTIELRTDLGIFPNQLELAKNIYGEFMSGTRWIIMIAEFQVGKTGVLTALAEFLHNPDILPLCSDVFNGEVVVLMGMSDNALRAQTRERVSFEKVRVLQNTDIQKIIKDYEGGRVEKVEAWKTGNPLFIIDESHFGAEARGVVSKFLKLVGVSADGNKDAFTGGAKVLSVSATPIAEFYNYRQEVSFKTMMKLEPGLDYYGIVDMFSNNKIQQSWSLKSEIGMTRFKQLVMDMVEIDDLIGRTSYIVVRLPKDEYSVNISRMFEHDFVDTIKYNMEDTRSFEEVVKNPPTLHTTLIFVFKKLSAGCTFSTEHISLMFDTADSKVDTAGQSFLGRMCGYGKNKHTQLYCDRSKVRQYAQWVQSGFSLENLPTKALHVSEKRVPINSRAGVPILLPRLEDDQIDHIENTDGSVMDALREVTRGLPQVRELANNGFNTIRVSRILPNNQDDYIYRYWTAPLNAYTNGSPHTVGISNQVQNGKYITACYDGRVSSETYGHVLLMTTDFSVTPSFEYVGKTDGDLSNGRKGEMFYSGARIPTIHPGRVRIQEMENHDHDNVDLATILTYKLPELKAYARHRLIRGFSKMRKAELVEAIRRRF